MSVPVPGRVAEALRRSTVQIRSGSGRREGWGSGVVTASDRVITNAHVLQGDPVLIESWDGKALSGSIVRTDLRRDLALLSLSHIDAPSISLAESSSLRPGTPVFAIGHPFGFVGALSSGVIHGVERFRVGGGGPLDWIAADVRLGPGNSGGPLANMQGQLVGLNTMITSGHLALAVPSREIQRFLTRRNATARFGATLRPVRLRDGRSGMLILETISGGAAESASLFPGDILVAADRGPLHFASDLQDAIEEATGGILPLNFLRGNQAETRQVVVRLQYETQRSAA